MPKFSALTAVVLAFLVVPALASAAPTASEITTPANLAFVTHDQKSPGTFHVAGTTLGGGGNVDLLCYSGGKARLVASNVPVAGGAFSADVPLTAALIAELGYPHPFCMLRAVPTGTVPSAPPDLPSAWIGAFVGWGQRDLGLVGSGFGPTPADAIYDYYVTRAQSKAFSDYDSIAACGLCDTYLFAPGTQAASKPIWYGNAVLYGKPNGLDRSGVRVDGGDAYTATSAYYNGSNHHLADNPGFPALSVSDSVDSANGNLAIDERAPFVTCAEDRSVFPPSDASCASFSDTGVHYERSIRQTDSGQQITIVDHWKSVDGKPHELDLIYDDSSRGVNAAIAGRESRANFTWTQDGFSGYPDNTQIPLPAALPAAMLVKSDRSTPENGDDTNPFGAMVFGSMPSELKVLTLGGTSMTSEWQTRYQRTVPAGGEITIAVAYVHDLALTPVKNKVGVASTALTPPTVAIDSPADGGTIDAASAHVTGTVSSLDGQTSVQVNGVAASVSPDGHWSADVPLGEGANQILAAAANKLGVTTNAIVTVSRAVPPAAAPVSPTTTAVAAVAKPVRCVVPKLRGKRLTTAKRLLKRAHCRLGRVVRRANANVKPGRVVKTRFKAGTRHRAGTRIRVTLAKKARRPLS
jgi:hypothetical protein